MMEKGPYGLNHKLRVELQKAGAAVTQIENEGIGRGVPDMYATKVLVGPFWVETKVCRTKALHVTLSPVQVLWHDKNAAEDGAPSFVAVFHEETKLLHLYDGCDARLIVETAKLDHLVFDTIKNLATWLTLEDH